MAASIAGVFWRAGRLVRECSNQFLYAANYVSETILLEAERRDMKAQVGERNLEDAVARGRIQSLEDDFRASQSRGEETKEDFSRPSQHYFSGWSVGGSTAYTGTDPVA